MCIGLIVLLGLTGAVVWGEKTDIPDLTVKKTGDFYIYSGHVILRETGKPMSKGFVYLVMPSGREIITSTPLADDGYFELQGQQNGLQLMITTNEIKQRKVSSNEVKFLKQLDKKIEQMFNEKNYGRQSLLLQGDAEIIIKEKEAILKAERKFNFKSQDIIQGESYDCLEAAYALKSYVKDMPEFYQAFVCHVPISYTLANGKKTHINHVVLDVVFKDNPTRTIHCFIDATPLAAQNIGSPFSPDLYLIDKQGIGEQILKQAQKSVTISNSVPLEVIGDLYIWSGISQHEGEIIIEYAIYRCKKAQNKPFQVLDTFTLQIQLQKESFIPLREEVSKYDPYTFLPKLPQYAKVVRAGQLDKKMQQVYLKTIPLLFEMIVKAKLVEEIKEAKKEN
jgi:hypothetical protein